MLGKSIGLAKEEKKRGCDHEEWEAMGVKDSETHFLFLSSAACLSWRKRIKARDADEFPVCAAQWKGRDPGENPPVDFFGDRARA
ncbi:MAG: hypothetical protein ACM3SW_13290 [Actinomycetota bacterium]